ncbi:MAG: hypothetical protein B7Z68_00410 [Acidobacteria bacterium 21-70-11]|nr:MAG: hypothetical protein B7Z68_00410 [Acidobacteria bacterium 21-70-11]
MTATGNGHSPDGTIPPGAIACTQAQYEGGYIAVNGAAALPPAPTFTLAQQATAALSAGLAITSTGTPALDATYPCDANTQAQLSAEVISLMLNSTFADGTTSIDWVDVNRTGHTMTAAQFKTVATAIGAYVSALTKCINGQSTTLPASSVTIS